MTASKPTLRATLKMTAAYVFALTTAVACGKFERIGAVKGTENGQVAVTAEGAPGTNLTIDKVDKTSDFVVPTEISFVVAVSITHGTRKIEFKLYPTINPSQQDARQHSIGTTNYVAEAICGDDQCSRYAILINAKDASNGTNMQRIQYWNEWQSTTVPALNSEQNTEFEDVTGAYEYFSGTKL